MDSLFERSAHYFARLQERIVGALEEADGRRFGHDEWSRPPVDVDASAARTDEAVLQGGGLSRVLEGGALIERGGVNVSNVYGLFSAAFARQMPGEGRRFRATGVSLVIHPRNPHVPTVHMNLRRIEHGAAGWFGGGADLTPYYLVEQDAQHFHRVHRAACEAHPAVASYPALKAACDRYFHLPHRGEARGIGGIFFDELRDPGEANFAFVQACGEAFLQAYLPIIAARREQSYGQRERHWQALRRGRYVEFNLLHDRGTAFGLRTGGRTESILMSMPPEASWRYDARPEPGSAEAALCEVLEHPRDWA